MSSAIRTGKIEIDTIKVGEPTWIVATVQKLELDENLVTTSVQMSEDKLYRRADRVVTEVVDIYDPVTQKSYSISVAGVSIAIKALMIKWMLEDNKNASYDEATDLVVLDDAN